MAAHVLCEGLQELAELRRAQTDDQAGAGAELATAKVDRGRQLLGNFLASLAQGFRQYDHRVDARHLGEHRDRLRPRSGQIGQGPTALERTGEAHGLDAIGHDQRLAHAGAVDHVEHPRRHGRALRRANDGARHPLGRRHVPAVGLEHHRATGGQCRSGIATGGGKCQREVAGAEHRYRAEGDAVLTQIRTR
ncbi:hypothetical protein D3C76_1270670 [compost metagenome]